MHVCRLLALLSAGSMLVTGCSRGSNATATPAIKLAVRTAVPTTLATSTPGIDTPTSLLGTGTPTPTVTATPRETPTPTAQSVSPTATPAPSKPDLLYAQLRPDTVSPGGNMHASVQTRGTVSKVVMYLGSGPGGPAPQSITLAEAAPGNWSARAAAPVKSGQYHFTIGLFDASGGRSLLDNDNWNVLVSGRNGASPPASTLPLPATLPLAPPFSYGDPVAAVFNAGGRTVNGSEVVSNSRPDVPGSAVSQYYLIHLPRAGWTVQSSSVPPASGGAFTIYAVSGSEAVLVQFSAGTVHLFYGPLGA